MNQRGKLTFQNTDQPKPMPGNVYWVNLTSNVHGESLEIKMLLYVTLLFVLC